MTNKQQILNLLNTNDKAIARALVVLNERQTLDEQSSENTFHHNGRGFTPADARMGTSMATFYSKFNRLSEKQLAYWKKPNAKGVPRINKYAGQLVEIAKEKAPAARPIPIVTSKPPKQPLTMGAAELTLRNELWAVNECIEAYGEGAMGEGPEQDMTLERLYDRRMQIEEQLEEIARCMYKMQEFA